ncbi:MAG: TolC family protein [Burkholderiales bacterium]|nr:TolC family protein [Burkholderiales bacterium]
MKHIIKPLALLPFILLGCAYNNTYHKPDVPVKNQWSVPDRNIESGNESNLPYIAWWQGFNDPLLNQLIESGLANNNSLNMSRGHIEAAEGELKKVQFQWIPDVSVLLGYSNNPATGFPGLLALIAPNYTMNVFSQIKQQKKAKYELAEAKAEDDAIKLTVISQITASYFTYLAEIERRALLQHLENDITHQADIAAKVYRGGLSADINVEELRSQVNLIRGEQQVIEQNIVVSRNALQYLINHNPGNLKTTKPFADFNNKKLIPGALPLTVLENRPDMQMAENRLRASNEGIGLAASELLPTVQLDFIGGPVAGNNNYYFPTPLTTNNMVDFNDQLLKIPVFKMSAFGEIAKARGLDKVSYYNYVETLQKALRDTTNALSANQRLTEKLTQTESATAHLAKAYNLNQRLYQKGIQSYLSTLNSKIAWDRIQINLNQDKLQQLLTIVNLYQEVAGGYKSGEKAESSN